MRNHLSTMLKFLILHRHIYLTERYGGYVYDTHLCSLHFPFLNLILDLPKLFFLWKPIYSADLTSHRQWGECKIDSTIYSMPFSFNNAFAKHDDVTSFWIFEPFLSLYMCWCWVLSSETSITLLFCYFINSANSTTPLDFYEKTYLPCFQYLVSIVVSQWTWLVPVACPKSVRWEVFFLTLMLW